MTVGNVCRGQWGTKDGRPLASRVRLLGGQEGSSIDLDEDDML